MLDHFANAISHLWNPGTTWEKFAPPKMCSKMPFSPLEKKTSGVFPRFYPTCFFLKISVSKRCLSLTAVKASLRFTPRGFPPFLGCGFPRPEGIASILIRFTPSPGPSWLFGTSDLGRTELRWWDVFFGRWKLVVFSESLKKVGGFMVGQPTPLRQEGVGWLAIMKISGICWWNPKSFSCFPTLVDIFINWFPTRKHGEWMQFFPPLRNLTKSLGWKKKRYFSKLSGYKRNTFWAKRKVGRDNGVIEYSKSPLELPPACLFLVVPNGIPSQIGRLGFCISTVLTFAGGVSL